MEGQIIKFTPAADRIFPAGDMRQIATGYFFTEGPVWDIKADCLYFTDFQHSLILKWTETAGAVVYREQANRAVGLTMAADGRIISAETSSHSVAYIDDKTSVVIAGTYQGKMLNSPNDVVVSGDGSVFFTDPYSKAMNGPRELDFNGVFAVNPAGEIRLLNSELGRPNGIAFSPDESILYVNDTDLQQLFAFQMQKDGSASKIGVFANLDTSYGQGAADGMKVDIEGNVYVTGPGGIWVLGDSGTPIALLKAPEVVGNFCFGGKDNKTIFLTASTSVYTFKAGIPGIVPYRNN